MIKETTSISNGNIVKNVFIAALHAEDIKEREKIAGNVEVRRFKLVSRGIGKNIFSQILKYLEYIFKVSLYYRNKKIGMVNIHALGLLPLGVFLKYAYNAKLIYDTHELETETNGLNGIRKKLAKLVEKLLIKSADQVFVVSESIADWYKNAYQIPRPVVVMNAPKLKLPIKSNYFREKFSIPDTSLIVLYQGALVNGRGVESILFTFKARSNNNAVIIFMGYGELVSQIQDATEKYNNIFFHPAVPPDVVLEYTVSADVGIHMIKNTCLNHYYCMPNKLFEYAMAGIPVIVSDMLDMRHFVEHYSMGAVVEGSTIDDLNHAIDRLCSSNLEHLKKNTRLAAEENSWNIQESKMNKAYQNLLSL